MKLFEHQEQVLEETKGFDSVAYFLDMGLGKTFVGSEKMIQIGNKVNLLICQKSKINDWVNHFETYYKDSKPFFLIDDLTKWTVQRIKFHLVTISKEAEDHAFPHIYIINYELAWRRKELLKLEHFTLMLDESSLIQNTKAKQTKFILKMKPSNVILLSGTPTAGKYENLVSQANLLGWNISEKVFFSQYINWKKIDVKDNQISVVDKDDPYKNVDRLKRKLKEHGAVFMKTEDVISLPEQVFIPVKIKPSKEYKRFEKTHVLELPEEDLIGDTELTFRLSKRKLCGMYSNEKLEAFKDLIESTQDNLICFYNFNMELEKLKKISESSGRTVGIINGNQKDEPEGKSILLIQYQAGAYGLNLQSFSNKIIYFSLPDKSELFEQSQKRIHRIGQKETCFYYLMMVMNSIETREILPTLKIRKEWTDELFK